jgi:hypothetical protein
MSIHLWENVSGARSLLHGDLGSATVSGVSRRRGKEGADLREDEGGGDIKERSDMDDLERELKAGLGVM